jgi:putative ABC transport system permease protein
MMGNNYFKLALRNLQKRKTSTAINLAGLTLGVSACLAIYLIASFELGFDRFHPSATRIYRVVGRMKFDANSNEEKIGFVPYALPKSMREEIAGLEHLAAFINFETAVIVPDAGKPDKVFARRNMEVDPAEIILAEPEYFEIFQYEWLAGNPKTALNEPYQVVLSEKKAKQYFGDRSPDACLGQTVIYSDSLRMTVSGIVRDWAQRSDLSFNNFLSYATIAGSFLKNQINLTEWNDVWSASQAFVQLGKNTSPVQIEAQFPAFTKAHVTGEFMFSPALQPMSGLHFDADYQDNYSRKAHLPTLYGLMGIAGFILLLAVINFINLSTAQSFQRAREVGIRKVMGSSRKSLITYFLSESLMLCVGAVLLAMLIVPQVFTTFESFLPRGLRFQINGEIWAVMGLIAVTTALLAGFYPAFVLSGYLPVKTLKGQTIQDAGQKGHLRQSLIVFQFVVSVFFILSTLIVNRQIAFMRNKDLGFQSDAVLMLPAPMGVENKTAILYPQIQKLAGVEKSALQVFEPMGKNFGLDIVTYKGKTEQSFEVSYKMGDENFIPFYEMKMLAGRNLLKSEEGKALVITESMITAMGLQKPEEALDKQLIWTGKPYPIVGVVADFHQQSMHEKIPPTFITSLPGIGNMVVKLRGQTPAETEAIIAQIAGLWAAVYPNHKMEYGFLDDEIGKLHEKERKTSSLVHLATFIAIFISCLGLYGLTVFSAARRTKEIGIRKVLGASVAGITGLLAKDFLKLVVIAVVIASPVAYYCMQQWLADFAYRIEIHWWMFAAAGAVAMAIAFLTVGGQAMKAALSNPVESLRSE